jgi:hypothetical protein
VTAEEIVQSYQVKLIDYSIGQVVYIKNNCNLSVNTLKLWKNTDNQIKENKMKDTVKTLMIVAGVGFTLIAITWIGMLATLLITWIGGNI